MKLLILVETEGLPATPDLREEMLRHLILLESLGANIFFYTSGDPSIACDALIDLAPSIVSKRTILPILSNRDITTLNPQEICGIKYNTVMNCVKIYNDKHLEDPIYNYKENVIVLDSSSHFISYIAKHAANRFTAFAIDSETNKELAILYNANLQRAKDDIEPLKAMANLRQEELKNSQAYLRLRYEQVELEVENKIAATMFAFISTRDPALQQPSELHALKLQCKAYLTATVVEESVADYKERLLQYGEALLKTDGNLYRVLTVIQQNLDKTTLDETVLNIALDNYRDRTKRLVDVELHVIDAAQSYTELSERYKTYRHETDIKLSDKVTETALATEEIDQNIKAIKKEFDETVGARKQDLLIESLLYTGPAPTHSSSADPYASAYVACRSGDLHKLKTAIAVIDNFRINRLHLGKTLLETACEHAYAEIVRYLVCEKGADVDSTLSSRRPIFSALHGLKQYPNRVEILHILLENRAFMGPMIVDCEGNTPLHVAAQQANVKAFQLIALWIMGHTDCFDLCAINNAGRTALLEAIYADKNSTRLAIIQIMFSHGIGISRDEIEILRKDGKLKLDIIKDVAEKYSLPLLQHTTHRRDSIVSTNDRLTRTRSNLSGPNLSNPPAENASLDLRGAHSASTSSLQTIPLMPRRNSIIDSTPSSAAAALTTPPATPRKRGSSILSLNLTSLSSTTTVSTPPATPRAKLPLETLRATAEPSHPSPRNSSSGSPSEQNRQRSWSIKSGFGLFSPRNDSPNKQPTTLFEAVRCKNYEALRLMLKDMEKRHKRSEANQHGDNGRTALFEAVINVDREAIKCFYDAGICLSKLEIQMLLTDSNRSESIRALNDVTQEIRNLLSDQPSPRPERRRGSILYS